MFMQFVCCMQESMSSVHASNHAMPHVHKRMHAADNHVALANFFWSLWTLMIAMRICMLIYACLSMHAYLKPCCLAKFFWSLWTLMIAMRICMLIYACLSQCLR